MKKCTLCVDRIYNETLPEAEREPACVATCPSRARHFGDLGDPDSFVSKLVAERSGVPLMPELGYAPTNRYLPPRKATIPAKPLERHFGAPNGDVAKPAGGHAPAKHALPAQTLVPAKPLEHQPTSGGNALLRMIDKVLSR
jgi:hypothetical protein